MKKIKYRIRQYFGFSKKEANGFLLILFMLILLFSAPFLVNILYPARDFSDPGEAYDLDSLVASLNKPEGGPVKEAFIPKEPLFHFDPNQAGEAELSRIFGNKVAGTIIRFRQKGGKFFKKEDLKKIFGLHAETYQRVEPYILIPEAGLKKGAKAFHQVKQQTEKVSEFDINTCDTASLRKLKGIGKVLSLRILKYRDLLGGFISENQYSEVYGLDTVVIKELTQKTFVADNYAPVRLNINNASIRELMGHPYIGKKYAQIIINYKQQHPPFRSPEDLKNIVSIPEPARTKMLPYLSF